MHSPATQDEIPTTESSAPTPETEALDHLRRSLRDGRDWPDALLEAMALWTAPREAYEGRQYNYFIGGEAFEWLLLAERLCESVDGLIPENEKEDLLFTGQFPAPFDQTRFSDLLGVEKYRGYLNYFYGVTVEEALQLAVEYEVQKRRLSGGNRYQDDLVDEAYTRLYRAPKSTLLKQFREDKGYSSKRTMDLNESKEFTYWLFKYRLRSSDSAKIASDTVKGLRQLQQMRARARPQGG